MQTGQNTYKWSIILIGNMISKQYDSKLLINNRLNIHLINTNIKCSINYHYQYDSEYVKS